MSGHRHHPRSNLCLCSKFRRPLGRDQLGAGLPVVRHWWACVEGGWAFQNIEVFNDNLEPFFQAMSTRFHETTAPFPSPFMAGGLFSMDKKFFFELGSYDDHLSIWGGENVEMSLRVWQCGGRVEFSPCSRVGHLFRSSSPYSFGGQKQVGEVLYANLIRVAHVWMDEWRHFFLKVNPGVRSVHSQSNRTELLVGIEERIELRRRLQCKSFEWFLNHVWPGKSSENVISMFF